jgi:hypothetical protein
MLLHRLKGRAQLVAERDAYLVQLEIAIGDRNELRRQLDVAIGARTEVLRQLAEMRLSVDMRQVSTKPYGPIAEPLQDLRGGIDELRAELAGIVASLSEWRRQERLAQSSACC